MPSETIDRALRMLERYWGYSSLRPHQEEAIHSVVGGRDSVVVLPTGGGKSICFQLPALMTGGLALVVSPLISLMKDQVDALQANGIAAECYHSAMPPEERRRVLRRLSDADGLLLYVSPERLVGDGAGRFLEHVRGDRLRYVAIDEAHCISHWGHEFRPEYRRLGTLRDAFPEVSFHAFTATATDQVRRDIAAELRLVDPEIIVGSFDRPNLVYRVLRKDSVRSQVRRVLARHAGEAGIVYCLSRREVDSLADHLRGEGYRAVPYHAGLDDDLRRTHQDAFSRAEADVVVATVAFGMGIDRSDVRFVIHASAPRSLEHYQQESGRAGRDGLEAECVLIWSGADLATWKRILERSNELTPAADRQLADMAGYASAVRCRHRLLVEHFGQRLEGHDCGACDLCLGELEPVEDPLILAQKILSCVVRVGQRWGIGHVIDVLRGRSTTRVEAQRHDRLTTFGLLAKTPVAELRAYVEQLIDRGHLDRSTGDYPTLSVTESGWKVLREETVPELFRHRRPAARRRRTGARDDVTSWAGVDEDLFERLRALRKEVADERGVPPYVVFHDRSLRDMARIRPTTEHEFRSVYGVGERKAADLGERFVAEIAGWSSGHGG